MKAKTSSTIFSVITLAILMLGFASAATIASDNFDASSTLNAGWIVTSQPSLTGAGWAISTTAANSASGSNHIEALPNGASSVATPHTTIQSASFSTSGYQNIIFSYKRQLGQPSGSFEASDQFKASWSTDGITFTPVETVNGTATDANYVLKPFALTSLPSNANLIIRFECTTNAADEFCRVDDVSIDGTAIGTSSSNLSITSPTSPIIMGQNATLTVTNSGAAALNVIMSEITSPLFGVTFLPSTLNNLVGSATVQAITAGLTNLKFGLNNVQVQAASGSQTATSSFQVRKTFCSNGAVGSDLSIANIDISNDGEGDENSWELLDDVTIEIEVENNNQTDSVDAIVKMGLFDLNGDNVADDLTYLPDSEGEDDKIDISIDEDDKETVTFSFKVPADFDAGSYKLAVKVYDDDAGESEECRDTSSDFNQGQGFYEPISIDRASKKDRYVIVDDISFDSSPVACGEISTGKFTVFNVGEKDQDQVKIIMKNTELDLNQEFEISSNLDKGDDETKSFSFVIPAGSQNKQYKIDFRTLYDYKNGVYREESGNSFPGFLEVAGCSSTTPISGPASGILITASLESDAKAGEDLVVEATITNAGTASKTIAVSADNYNDWAKLKSASQSTVTLDAGESKKITFTFTVNDDAAGAQTFDVKAASDATVTTQQVEVNLAETSTKGKFSLNLGSGNSLIWLIGIINVVLILLIIIVAVKVSRR